MQDAGRVVTMQSSAEEKIRLFRAMFCGREDVFAERWESKAGKTGYQPACANQWIRGVCPKCAAFGHGGARKVPVSCAECPARQFEPITDRIVANHLRGLDGKGKPFTMGVYPLLADDTVRFAAIDFDKASWRADVHSVVETLRDVGLPVACERSRSGNGAHLWFFFEEPEPAGYVRDVLSFVLTLTMERNPSMGLDSYDRIFPNQSRVPKGGFGNLIALPLSTASGLPSNVSVLREKKLDETYAESVKRLLRDGVTAEEVDLFAFAAAQQKDIEEKDAFCISVTDEDEENARSAVERFLHRHLEALPATKGLFELNGKLEIPFGANPYMEVDFLSRTAKLAVEVDGSRHFDDKNAYRRDRRKDELLQDEGYFVLRFLAEDVMADLGMVMDRIVRHLGKKGAE